jgi:hypothetical protein
MDHFLGGGPVPRWSFCGRFPGRVAQLGLAFRAWRDAAHLATAVARFFAGCWSFKVGRRKLLLARLLINRAC